MGKGKGPAGPFSNLRTGTGFLSCSGVPVGLFMIPHRHPCGRWCFAWLIRQAETLELQVRSAHPPMPHRTGSSSCSGVPVGLFMIPHHRPCGRRCFARLIRQAETLELQLHSQPPSKRTALSPLKRSCFRFAPLTLRLRTETFFQKVPVFRMAYSAPTAHCAVSSETLMLQVRCANPPMPHRTGFSSCSGVPHGLFSLSHRLQNAG